VPLAFPPIPTLRTPEGLAARVRALGSPLPVDAEFVPEGPLAEPVRVAGRRVGNRFCAQPMEGWDGEWDGRPSGRTRRRWRRFGASGPKLVWGCEAVAVRRAARANPRQFLLDASTEGPLAEALALLRATHRERYGGTDDLLVGLQLTHSGRYGRPEGAPAPRIAYHHPVLDARVGVRPDDDRPVLTDAELDELVGDVARAARRAQELGFDFVGIQRCHGYLGHELLSEHTRPGPYGGDLAGRTRFLRRAVVAAVVREAQALLVGVRLSAFDLVPFRPGPGGRGEPEPHAHLLPYADGFGVDAWEPTRPDLAEARRVLAALRGLGVALLDRTAGSPYKYPARAAARARHRPGTCRRRSPWSGWHAGSWRSATSRSRRGPWRSCSGCSYPQDFVVHVAEAVVRAGWTDFVGLGRMLLAYPELPGDALEGRLLDRRRFCRTFSDCTTAPRDGLPSGCYPSDPGCRQGEGWVRLQAIQRALTVGSPREEAGSG